MARIEFRNVAHSYAEKPQSADDYALHRMNHTWEDGGAYALLGPSGCGKSTMLNICSGLLKPSEGQILLDGEDVTTLPPEARNIAQVFQFPVVYDSMSVYDNLAFPLRNRRVPEAQIKVKVHRVAEMLELGPMLRQRAQNLSADQKQKISMGRGLVRNDVSAILFDEPLTVIDPQLKWHLRRQLKEIHKEFKLTLIYVTHDQTEALTFADQVVVMSEGEIVQIGTPPELFETPAHTFVGHFIGSPGMNLLPCEVGDNAIRVDGRDIPVPADVLLAARSQAGTNLKLGIRPEFISLGNEAEGLPVRVESVADMGQYKLVNAMLGNYPIKAKLPPESGNLERGDLKLNLSKQWIRLYANDRLIDTKQGASHG